MNWDKLRKTFPVWRLIDATPNFDGILIAIGIRFLESLLDENISQALIRSLNQL